MTHIINGEFQSDKYPTCPPGKVPLSTKDPKAQDLLWEYAQRRRAVDPEFADDLETALKAKGFDPPKTVEQLSVRAQNILLNLTGFLSPSVQQVRDKLGADKGYGWQSLFKVKYCGLVSATEIAEWAGIPVDEWVQKRKCPTCGRQTNRSSICRADVMLAREKDI